MSIARYRKKPVEIDAMKFEHTSKCLGELKEWMGDSFGHCIKNRYPNALAELSIMTLEDGVNLKQPTLQQKEITSSKVSTVSFMHASQTSSNSLTNRFKFFQITKPIVSVFGIM